MRARQFILKEYSREKTAQSFGDKLVTALGNDKSHALGYTGGPALGTARAYIQQKTKLASEVELNNKTIIINDILQSLEHADPTKNKEYVQWLAKLYANTNVKMEDLLSRGNSALKQYHEFKVKNILPADVRDIGRIDFNKLENIAQNPGLLQALHDKTEQEAVKTMPKGKSTVMFENDKVRIILPEDAEAACYYGQGTRWCTAARDNNMFDRYAGDGPLWILLPKQPKYDGEKYQLHFSSGQFMDEGDNSVEDIIELLDMRFGNLVDFFRQAEPAINDWIVFADDATLTPLLDKIKTAVSEHVSELVGDWEADDDYWREYLIGQGYVHPEGHNEEGEIDWDKVAKADESYSSWNYDVGDFISKINGAVDLAPSQVRELAEETGREWGADTQEISDLDKIMAHSLSLTSNDDDGDGGITEWIHQHIYIKKRDGKWDVSLIYVQKDGKRKEYAIN